MPANQQKMLRLGAGLIGIAIIALGIGFALNIPWATSTWPWPDGPLSHLFVGSILAAVGAGFVWIGITAEWGTAAGGAITGLVITTGQVIFLLLLAGQPTRQGLLLYAGGFAVVGLVSLGLLRWSRRFPIRDLRPTPRLLRISYGVFALVLFLAAGALILQVQIFPWPLNPDSAVMYGWIFMGNASYFVYALLRPGWASAAGQLASFLAYDLVLLPAFLGLFAAPATNLLSLVLYCLILFYSALLAIYYLFVNPATRAWAAGPQTMPLPQQANRASAPPEI